MKKTLMVLLVLVLALAMLAGCGGKDKGSDSGSSTPAAPEGKYALTSIKMDGADATPFLAMAGITAENMYLDFSNNGNVKLSFMGMEGEGTFKVDGTKLTITVEGSDMDFVFDNNKITLAQNGEQATAGFENMEMVFEK